MPATFLSGGAQAGGSILLHALCHAGSCERGFEAIGMRGQKLGLANPIAGCPHPMERSARSQIQRRGNEGQSPGAIAASVFAGAHMKQECPYGRPSDRQIFVGGGCILRSQWGAAEAETGRAWGIAHGQGKRKSAARHGAGMRLFRASGAL